MSFSILAVEVIAAPDDKFTSGSALQNGWWIASLFERYGCTLDNALINEEDIIHVYNGIKSDLENEESKMELLHSLQEDEPSLTIKDIEDFKLFLKECIDNEYCLSYWY